jgi:hypothetical protein
VILNLQNSTHEDNLFIHGVLKQDPGTGVNDLVLFHHGATKTANWDEIIAKNILGPTFKIKIECSIQPGIDSIKLRLEKSNLFLQYPTIIG